MAAAAGSSVPEAREEMAWSAANSASSVIP
jgi:hypothetical protein